MIRHKLEMLYIGIVTLPEMLYFEARGFIHEMAFKFGSFRLRRKISVMWMCAASRSERLDREIVAYYGGEEAFEEWCRPKPPPREIDWQPYFAWFPVLTDERNFAWLRWVERRKWWMGRITMETGDPDLMIWCYRVPGAPLTEGEHK
jgi:hypothetical protein